MGTLDRLLFRPRPVELRSARSKREVLERLRDAFPPRDLWALVTKPFAPPVNVGSFVGDAVRLSIIDLRQRDWLRPELHGQLCALFSLTFALGIHGLVVLRQSLHVAELQRAVERVIDAQA